MDKSTNKPTNKSWDTATGCVLFIMIIVVIDWIAALFLWYRQTWILCLIWWIIWICIMTKIFNKNIKKENKIQENRNKWLQKNNINIEEYLINEEDFIIGYSFKKEIFYIIDYNTNDIEKINFSVNKWWKNEEDKTNDLYVCLDNKNKKILFLGLSCKDKTNSQTLIKDIINYKDIQKIEIDISQTIIKNWTITTKTKTKTWNMLLRGVVGGMLLWPVGAIVWGATASKKSVSIQESQNAFSKTYLLILKMKNLDKPIITIDFWKSKKDAYDWEHILKTLCKIKK